MKHRQATTSKTPNRDNWVKRGIAVPVNNLHIINYQSPVTVDNTAFVRVARCGVTLGFMTFEDRLVLSKSGRYTKPGCVLSVCQRCVDASPNLEITY